MKKVKTAEAPFDRSDVSEKKIIEQLEVKFAQAEQAIYERERRDHSPENLQAAHLIMDCRKLFDLWKKRREAR